MRIKKVINNNILCAVDDQGSEMIVSGKGLGFNRFVVRLRYFAQRLFQAAPGVSGNYDPDFQEMIIRSCKQHYKCAQCVGEYIRNTYQKDVSDEELIYLTIHLKRINLSKT